jgi:hypothetical protein
VADGWIDCGTRAPLAFPTFSLHLDTQEKGFPKPLAPSAAIGTSKCELNGEYPLDQPLVARSRLWLDI